MFIDEQVVGFKGGKGQRALRTTLLYIHGITPKKFPPRGRFYQTTGPYNSGVEGKGKGGYSPWKGA